MAKWQIWLALLAILSHQALGIAISTPVLEQNTLHIPEGGNQFFPITIQNVGESDIAVKVSYSSDAGVANIVDEKKYYTLPAGSTNTKVVFNISAPMGSKINDVFDFKFSVTPIQSEGGAIPLLPGISKQIKIQVDRAPDRFYLAVYLQENGWMWAVVAGVLAAYLWYSRKKKR